MIDAIDAVALITAAAVAALIVTLAVHAEDSRINPHRYDSRCPLQSKDKRMKIPLTSHTAILARIAELEGRLTALELRMHDHDRHDGGDGPERYQPHPEADTDFATYRAPGRACKKCGRRDALITGHLCWICYGAEWDARIDAEADRLEGGGAAS